MDVRDAPDPISEPKGYQDHLLAWLGDDDPAEVQAGTPQAWRDLLADGGAAASVRPAPREWAALGCLAHAADAELVMSARYRWIVAHDEPPLIGYDQDLWVDRLHEDDEDPEPLLALLGALKATNVEMWRASNAEQRARVGIHAERGPESYDLSFRMIAGHDRFHLAQARRAIEAARGR
jgi:DinB family protein